VTFPSAATGPDLYSKAPSYDTFPSSEALLRESLVPLVKRSVLETVVSNLLSVPYFPVIKTS